MRDDELSTALRAAVRGDESGFATLWRSLNPAVLRYLRVVCGDAAEDAASETWLQVARDLPGFTGDAVSFRVWVFRIARHRGIDDTRRAWRKREQARAEVDTDGDRVQRDVVLDVIDNSGTEWALRLIGTLPPDQAEAVLLRVVAGLDAAGAAQVLGKRAGAVRIAAMRGLRRLAAHPQVHERHPGTAAVPAPRDGLRVKGGRADERA